MSGDRLCRKHPNNRKTVLALRLWLLGRPWGLTPWTILGKSLRFG